MNNQDLNEILNIGIPCYNSLEINLSDLTLTCSKDIYESINVERRLSLDIKEKIEKEINHKSFNYKTNFFKNINFMSDINSVSIFGLDKKQLLINLFSSLTILDRKDKITMIQEIIIKRKKLLEQFLEYINHNSYTKEFHKNLKTNFNFIYRNKPYNIDLREYLKNEIEHYNKLIKYYNSNPNIVIKELFDYYLYCLDTDKVGLFIAYNYILQSKKAIEYNNYDVAQKYLFYVTAYFKKNNNINIKIISKDKKINISYDELYKMYIDLLNKNIFLKELYLDRSIFQNNSVEDNKVVINNLIKNSDILNNIFLSNISSNEFDIISKNLSDKLYLYLKNNPVSIVRCNTCENSSFYNYLAFIYENGIILLDRFLNIESINELNNDAIYVLNTYNYEKNINRKKIELINDRILHISDWQDKVNRLTNLDTTDDLKESTKILVKSIKKD